MKATLDRRPCHEALAIALRATNSRSSLAICSHVLLKATADAFTLSTTDLESGCEITLPAQHLEPGELCLPAQLLTNLLATLPEGELTITSEEGNAELRAGRSRFRLNGLTEEAFPVLPPVESTAGFTLPEAAFNQALREVDKAFCVDDTRPLLRSVHLRRTGDRLRLAATDTHRLAVTEIPVTGAGDDFAVLILSEVVALLLAATQATGTRAVVVRFDDKSAEFRIEGQRFITRLLAGTYPNFEHLIPTEHAGTATLSRQELTGAVRRLDVLAKSAHHRLLLAATGEGLRLEVEAGDLGRAEEELTAEVTGEIATCGISAGYLLASLAPLETERVVIERSQTSPVVIIRPEPPGGYFNLIALMNLK